LVAYTLVPAPISPELDATQVQTFVLEDAMKAFGDDASYAVLRTEKVNDRWEVDLKIGVRPHAKCPTLIKREYTFPPVYFREELWNDRCAVGSLILYEEEAIMATVQLSKVQTLPEDARGYATKYSAGEIALRQSCEECSAFEQFVKRLEAKPVWIVQWKNGETGFFVAIDESGAIVANS